jgi:tetratricopeptide (TPR) repeat protein
MRKRAYLKSEEIMWDDPGTSDPLLAAGIDEFMRAKMDIEDVLKDPMLGKTRIQVKTMEADHLIKSENTKFIKEALSESFTESKAGRDISEIKAETKNSDIYEISTEWVEEWQRRKRSETTQSHGDRERSDFISDALSSEVDEPITTYRRKSTLKYFSLSAAAIVGVIVMINILKPSSDPDRIFASFYKPFDALSPISRGENLDVSIIYNDALSNYESGNFEKAESGFAKSAAIDPSYGSPDFFLGLTNLAMENYKEAISHFSEESAHDGNFHKETVWFLGLTYLKTGNKANAINCFKELAASKGYYSVRSASILRRLR